MKFRSGERMKVLEEFLQQVGGFGVIDGGLATQLESHGADLDDPLWSGRCLIESPHLIREVHQEYLEAGAEIIITASYQATIQGFESKGLSITEGEALLRRSVEIACEAREQYWKNCAEFLNGSVDDAQIPKVRPILVAASVGSYGAYLADGSEYSGDYGSAVTIHTLKDFHRRRVQVLADSGADLLAFETIPNKLEAQAYVELLEENDIQIPAWFSFNSKDGVNVVGGDSFTECAALADSCTNVVAVGINCTPPRFIHGLILSIQKDLKLKNFQTLRPFRNPILQSKLQSQVTAKPILVYPNSGETYDADRKQWVASNGVSDVDFVSYVQKWQEIGASLIGGCCRTTPHTIKAISRAMNRKPLILPPQHSMLDGQ